MNDFKSGYLAAEQYHMPDYVLSKLLLQSGQEFVSCHGQQGQFDLAATPATRIILRWGAVDGPALLDMAWKPARLGWEGQVAVGGYIDAIHLSYNGTTRRNLGMIYLGGQPMKQAAVAPPPNTEPAAHHGLAADLSITCTTWIVDQDDPMLSYAQSALFHNATVHLFGRLLGGDDPLVQSFDLPISLEGMTVFSS